MPRVTKQEKEAIDWLREWAREGFPRRVDGSFPTDFLTAFRRLADVPKDKINSRALEMALCAGPDFSVLHPTWSWDDTVKAKERMRG